MNYQEIILEIIVRGSSARSYAMEAINLAKEGKFDEAKISMEKCCNELSEAHKSQTQLIQEEASGKANEITLLMVHAQDHLMNSITIKDMAHEFIDLYKKLYKKL
ncbi:MAG: PTS lactose/cellobiose transporter subunit IIA [Caloramator sp.]|nr:PTS lactose/cellobiose transporter subunit IIA [Caloramator sp.]